MIFACVTAAKANNIFYNVPFHHIEITAANKIYVNYNFDPRTQTLVCSTEQTDAITSVEWFYKDAMRRIDLPVTLQDNINFEGHFADPSGKLVITNDFGTMYGGSIFVSCEYRNMH